MTKRASSAKSNNSGDISWHKTKIFISEVFRFEELALELTTPGFYRENFRDLEVGELNAEELRFRAARKVVRASMSASACSHHFEIGIGKHKPTCRYRAAKHGNTPPLEEECNQD